MAWILEAFPVRNLGGDRDYAKNLGER